MPFLALPWAGFSTGMAVSASALAGTVTGSLGGAWAGTAALVTDRFAKSENRNGDLVADASMWLAQQNQAMRMTADFNLRHLFNGGDLGGYDLADFLQFGSFLIDYDFLDYHRISNVQQTSMVIDRLWKEDRVYILDIDSAKHSHVDSGTTCGNNEFRLTDNAGTDIRDARKVCLSEYPNREFWIFSWPRDGEAQAGAAKLVKDWYPPEKQRRARGIAGAADIDSVSLGFDWEVSHATTVLLTAVAVSIKACKDPVT